MAIDKAHMHAEFVLSILADKWTPGLTSMMQELASGVAHNKAYKCVSEREDMIQDGVLHLLTIWRKFNPAHVANNAFGYFTQALFRHYTKYYTKQIKREKCFTSIDNPYIFD